MNFKNNPTSKSSKIRVGLTIGDPAGIGPAISLKALQRLKGQADFTVIGNSFVLAQASRLLKLAWPGVKLIDLNNIQKNKFKFGCLSRQNGLASRQYLDTALDLLSRDKIDCLVTCPVSKEAISLSLPGFSGHTEYLGRSTRKTDLVMMLINDKLKFSLLTRHVPLKDVCVKLKRQDIQSNVINTVKGLKDLFLIKNPRLVFCGVNPHASDNGLIGAEERVLIGPAIKNLSRKLKGVSITGPISADAAITQAASGFFDCVFASYHDQALIALKLTGPDSGVNLTLGLPFVRTSPLHGVAFDIAADPAKANPNSLIAAVRLAIKCRLNQRKA